MARKPTTWRLIPRLDAPGFVQMSVDDWLLDRHRQSACPPTLRFYTWSSPTISLGYHQRRVPEFWRQLTWQGQPVSLVRRPTGGRAVLHDGDLTYSIVTSGLSGNRQQVYRQLCLFLIRGWQALGVRLQFGDRTRGEYTQRASCFATATAADLVTDTGAKSIGSAQLWRGDAVLQHGSMPLTLDRNLFECVFGHSPDSVTLPWDKREERSIDTLVSTLIEAARDCYDIEFRVEPLSDMEWRDIETYSKDRHP